MQIQRHHSSKLFGAFSRHRKASVVLHPDLWSHPLCQDIDLDISRTFADHVHTWTQACQTSIAQHLSHPDVSYFANIEAKDQLVQELWLLFCDVGFDHTLLPSLHERKHRAWQHLLSSLPSPPSIHTPVDVFGYAFDPQGLSFIRQILTHSENTLWMVDHPFVPGWLDAPDPEPTPRLVPINTLNYEHASHALRSIFGYGRDLSMRVGIVCDHPRTQQWLHKQCALVDIPTWDSKEDFDQAGLIIGPLTSMLYQELDALVVWDICYAPFAHTQLMTSLETNWLRKQNMHHLSAGLEKELLYVLQNQVANMSLLLDQNKNTPYVFFHPGDQPEPLHHRTEIFAPNQGHVQHMKNSLQTYQTHQTQKDWPLGEIELPLVKSPVRLSASALSTFATCPRQFYFRYIANAPQELETQEHFAQSPKDFGIMIHELLQMFYSHKDHTTHAQEIWQQQVKRILHKYAQTLTKHDPDIWHAEITSFCMRLFDYIQQDLQTPWTTHACEWSFEDKEGVFQALVGSQPQTPIVWTGQMDRIDKWDDQMRIVDFKTGRVNKKKSDLLEDGTFIQMPMYLYFMAQKHPDKRISASIIQIHPTHMGEVFTLTQDVFEAHLEEFRGYLQQCIQSMEQQTFYPDPGRDGEHCRTCSYQGLCGHDRMRMFATKEVS